MGGIGNIFGRPNVFGIVYNCGRRALGRGGELIGLRALAGQHWYPTGERSKAGGGVWGRRAGKELGSRIIQCL